jgi:hypothetical protein
MPVALPSGLKISVATAVAGPVMGARCAAWLRFWRLPVKQDPLHVHAQFGHFFKPFGADEVLPLAVGLVFHNPLKLLGGFDKDTSDRKRIHGSETVLLLGLGFHGVLLIGDGRYLPCQVLLSERVD